MKVILRNFINLLSAGAFNTEVSIEDMSEFKWKQLLLLADINGVADYISHGIGKAGEIPHIQIPTSISETVLHDISGEKIIDDEEIQYNLTSKETIKRFSCFYLNHKFNKIIFNEIHSIDTSIESLKFLSKSINNVNSILTSGINIRELIDFGLLLRKQGDKIDFIKVEKWIKSLKMNRILNFIGCHLVFLFGFEMEEIPFLKKYKKNTNKEIHLFLEKPLYTSQKLTPDIGIKKEKHIINQMYGSNMTTFKYFPYFPLEASCRFLSNMAKSLSSIEE